jgi:hypothetical protein
VAEAFLNLARADQIDALGVAASPSFEHLMTRSKALQDRANAVG